MALTFRLYRSARIGTGTRSDPYRSALTRYIHEDGTGATFEDWIQDPTDTGVARYALARCESAVHVACAADADVRPLSPEFANKAELATWLDAPVGAEMTQTIRDVVEADRIPIDDVVVGVTTRRQLWRRIGMIHRVGNMLRGKRDDVVLDLLRRDVSTTVSQMAPTTRTRLRAWMTNHGLDTSWVTNTTTMRQILKFVVANLGVTPNTFKLGG